MRGIVWILLCAELVDELYDGVVTAAWPAICTDLGLTYSEVGLLLGLPALVGNAVEPVIGIASEVWGRRRIAVMGGLTLTGSLLLGASAAGFWGLLAAFVLFYPSSGAFVGLSELDLVEQEGATRTRWMMVWMVVGSLGALLGPLLLLGIVWMGGSWRVGIGGLALASAALTWALWRSPASQEKPLGERLSIRQSLREVLRAIKDRHVQRVAGLLIASDLLLDVLIGFLALWVVESLGYSEAVGALAVTVYIGAMLLGSMALSRWMHDAHGSWVLRWSAAGAFVVVLLFIQAVQLWAVFGLLVVLGVLVSGWYPILKAAYYEAFPNKGGIAMAVHSVSSSIGGLLPIGVGWVADQWGLGVGLYAVALGAVCVWLGAQSVGGSTKSSL